MSHLRLPALLLLAPLVGTTGCAAGVAGDYFQLVEGNTWEYFVRNSELNDEKWTLQIKDADDNDQGSRGELYFELIATYTDATNPTLEYNEFRRRFNVSADNGGLGDDAPVIAWQYKQVNNDEGKRNENCFVQPESDPEWRADWDFDIDGEGGGSDFEYEISSSWSTDSVQTSVATFTETLYISRLRRTISNSGGDESVLTNLREEWYALDVGLVQYRDTAADGEFVEGVLFDTNVDDGE